MARYRFGRSAVALVVALLAGLLVIGALVAPNPPLGKAAGVAIFGGLCLAMIGTYRAGRRATKVAPYLPRPYDGPYLGRPVRGVAFPLRIADRGLRPWGTVLLGAGMFLGAAVTFTDPSVVEGGQGARTFGTVLLVLFGVILLPGGLLRMRAPSPGAAWIVLAGNALHVPAIVRGEPIRWDVITRVEHRVLSPFSFGVGSYVARRYLRENEVVEVYARSEAGDEDRQIARLPVTGHPDPGRLTAALLAARQDPAVRAGLADPGAAGWLARLPPAGPMPSR